MQLPEYDYTRQSWDALKAFHVSDRPAWWGSSHPGYMVQMATGEFMYTHPCPRPRDRGRYPTRGIQIVTTADDACPALYYDGARVPRAWLTRHGQQHLWIDHDHGIAVALARHHNLTDIPANLQRWAVIYYPNPKAKPQGGPIYLHPPKKLSDETLTAYNEVRATCRVWCEYTEQGAWSGNFKRYQRSTIAAMDFNKMSKEQRIDVAFRGWVPEYDRIEVPCLTLKP